MLKKKKKKKEQNRKADLIHAFEELVEIEQNVPQDDELIVDGSASVHSVRPTRVMFEEYLEGDFGKRIDGFGQTH